MYWYLSKLFRWICDNVMKYTFLKEANEVKILSMLSTDGRIKFLLLKMLSSKI